MPVAKPLIGGNSSVMKSEDRNESLEPFIRQAIAKESLIPLSRTGDNSVQWIQLLHALDQPDLLSWPLMTPIKVQMQKCKKCSLEFCSPINYRRHIRVHRRSFIVNKEFYRNKNLLAAFWDKLSIVEAEKVVSFDGVMLKEITGSSVITALASSLCNPGIWTLPQVYVRAGSSLLDIIQAKRSRLPIFSHELFCILNDASERTFLCAGMPESVQNYLFDEEATKNCLELKNLVASTSFLFEQQLVKAWVADKDAEALRWQELLVEEEEAAKKRQAELLERKKQNKLRRKEHKIKEQFHRCKDLNISVDATDRPVLAQVPVPSSPSDSSSTSINGPENIDSCLEALQNHEKDLEAQMDFSDGCISQGDSETCELQMVCESSQNNGTLEAPAILNRSRVWTEKDEMENHVESLGRSLRGAISHQNPMEESNCEVMIGSISIPVNIPVVESGNVDSNGFVSVEDSSRILYSNNRIQILSDTNALQGVVPFSIIAAKEFLAQRWKEAIAADHMQLVL